MTNPGLVQVELPADLLSASRPDLGDLRLSGPSGDEQPFQILRSRDARVPAARAREFRVELQKGATVCTFETGLTQALGRVILESPAPAFVKGVTVDGSNDGDRWETLVRGAQIFREPSGATRTAIELPTKPWRFLRLTVDDSASAPVALTGAEAPRLACRHCTGRTTRRRAPAAAPLRC